MNFSDVVAPVFRHAAATPGHPAFLFDGRTITYGELADQSRRIATHLLAGGVQRGDRVAILSANRPEIFSVYFGLALIGAAIVPINAEFAAHEIEYILGHSGAVMVIRTADLAGQVAAAVTEVAAPPRQEDLDDLIGRAMACAPYAGPQAGTGPDLALLVYTSGTTSAPKGVAASHANELASALAYSGMMAIGPADTVFVALPLSFSYGFHAAAYVALLSGATVLLAARFHPRLALETIAAQRPTVFLGVPTMYAMMADVAARDARRHDMSSLRLAAASGAALNDQIVADCKARLDLVVRPYYAMTEVRPIFSFDLREAVQPPPGSVGRLIAPTEVRIVDEAGADAAPGAVGELWVRGPSFAGAYYKDPERTAEAMTGDWFRTGDLVSRDPDGNYFIVGRNRDQIISGGAKIAPIEVEDALLTHPGIAAAAVVGSPDPIFGQVVKAVVVKADPGLRAEDVIAHCQGRIADYKVPRIVTFMEALPMAPSGKILKTALV